MLLTYLVGLEDYCEYLNKEKTEVKYDDIYGGNLNKLKWILRRFKQNLAERNMKENKIHQDILDCDPKVSVPCI